MFLPPSRSDDFTEKNLYLGRKIWCLCNKAERRIFVVKRNPGLIILPQVANSQIKCFSSTIWGGGGNSQSSATSLEFLQSWGWTSLGNSFVHCILYMSNSSNAGKRGWGEHPCDRWQVTGSHGIQQIPPTSCWAKIPHVDNRWTILILTLLFVLWVCGSRPHTFTRHKHVSWKRKDLSTLASLLVCAFLARSYCLTKMPRKRDKVFICVIPVCGKDRLPSDVGLSTSAIYICCSHTGHPSLDAIAMTLGSNLVIPRSRCRHVAAMAHVGPDLSSLDETSRDYGPQHVDPVHRETLPPAP